VTCADGDITQMNFQGNNLKGTIPSSLGSLTRLVTLWLDYNNLKGTIPSSLASLTQLTDLNLEFNNLKGTIPSSLASLTKLTYLRLCGNALTGLVPPLPFKQYSGGCLLDDPDHCKHQDPPSCNHFKCPLPAGSEQCKWINLAGVHCE
jgi:Leucine-rich repeat (LRR) protein